MITPSKPYDDGDDDDDDILLLYPVLSGEAVSITM